MSRALGTQTEASLPNGGDDSTTVDPTRALAAVDIAPGDSRYDVHSRADIVATMRALSRRRAFVTAYGAQTSDCIVTAVLAVHAGDDALVFDFGGDQAATERVLGAGDVRFVTQLDHIRVQFVAPVVGTFVYDEAPAFVTRIPDVMQRLQRRDWYRVHIPLSAPVAMTLAPDASNPDCMAALHVLDLSCGGVRLGSVPAILGISEDVVYRECRINLPALGAVVCDVRVVRVVSDDTKSGSCVVVGAFVDMPPSATTLLQRYINRLERERLAAG